MEEFVVLTKSGYVGVNKKGVIVIHSTLTSAKRFSYADAVKVAKNTTGKHIKL